MMYSRKCEGDLATEERGYLLAGLLEKTRANPDIWMLTDYSPLSFLCEMEDMEQDIPKPILVQDIGFTAAFEGRTTQVQVMDCYTVTGKKTDSFYTFLWRDANSRRVYGDMLAPSCADGSVEAVSAIIKTILWRGRTWRGSILLASAAPDGHLAHMRRFAEEKDCETPFVSRMFNLMGRHRIDLIHACIQG
ncbi:MAG: hypothetical protein GX647_09090 [Clostridiales bacterium]|nr:hypothetical protein [Clostridiales bacterium]